MSSHSPTLSLWKLLTVTALTLGLGLSTLQADREQKEERLTSRPRATVKPLKTIAVGETVRSRSGERQRLALPDGSILFINQQTQLKVMAPRRLTLTNGEVYVEVAPAKAPFVVKAPDRTITATGTRFAVRTKEEQTGVVVTQGKVQINGIDQPLRAGQQLEPGKKKPSTAPRASYALAWTRDLHIQGDSLLVPRSEHAGGSLIAIDPNGQEMKLSLRKYHVDVHIENGFARTTIDQTYFNHEANRLEGTFRFPLPADGSLSRLAMYVSGERMEGGMVERDRGRAVYETIVNQQKDPALLEWLDGTTFRMRVFPLEARQEKRIILSYTQRLSSLYENETYRFPAGHTLDRVGQWSFQATVVGGADRSWTSPSHAIQAAQKNGNLILTASKKNAGLDRDVVVELSGTARTEQPRFSTYQQDGNHYFMVRYRPQLSGPTERKPRQWVILFEASADRNPLLARAQIEMIRSLMSRAEPFDTFTVLAANTRARLWKEQLQNLEIGNLEAALKFLEESHLIGALDLQQAFRASAKALKGAENPYLVHIGSGIAAMGERRLTPLAETLPKQIRYVGIGVGRRWKRDLMKVAAERSGGYFAQVNPDEPISWRGFELASILNAPRLLSVEVSDGNEKNRYLPFTTLLSQGEEVCAVAQLAKGCATLPESVSVQGLIQGKRFQRELRVKEVEDRAAYLPRTWARLEIERLLAEDAAKHRKTITELSKQMYVMTPFTSLLVLENEAMYEEHKVDRGRKDHWAIYNCPKKIPVVYEPLPGMPQDRKAKGKPSAKDVVNTILVRSSAARSRVEVRGRLERLPALSTNGARTVTASLEGEPSLQLFGDNGDVDSRDSILAANDPVIRSYMGRTHFQNGRDAIERLTDKLSKQSPDRAPVLSNLPYSARLWGELAEAERTAKVGDILPLGSIPTPQKADLENYSRFVNGLVDSSGGIYVQQQTISSAPLRYVRFLKGNSPVNVGDERLFYRRPGLSSDARFFYDLVMYAPGMKTTSADIRAVIEAEAISTPATARGQIDNGSRELFAKARFSGSYAIEGRKGRKWLIRFDDQGRFTWQRQLWPGITEKVECDDTTLLHSYPDLGLGARRQVSRFHRAAFSQLVPWVLPEPEDMARGADLKKIDERTVALIPHGRSQREGKKEPQRIEIRLVFSKEGPLAERRLVLMPEKKVLLREEYSSKGQIRILNGKGEELAIRKGTLQRGEQQLAAKVSTPGDLVVLSLPYRTESHIKKVRKLEKKDQGNYTREDLLALLGSAFAQQNGSRFYQLYRSTLHNRRHREIGCYVLLAATGQNLDSDHGQVLRDHLKHPLAQYLALHSSPVLRKHASQWAVGSGQWKDGFIRYLAITHALLQRWQNTQLLDDEPLQQKKEIQQALEYIQKYKGSRFAWALLCRVQDRINERPAKEQPALHGAIASGWTWFKDVPVLSYAAQYEHARSLFKAGKVAEARKQFLSMYRETLPTHFPLFDSDFRAALLPQGKLDDAWSSLLRETASKLIEEKHRPALLLLARQCFQFGDTPQATVLAERMIQGIEEKKERQALTLDAIRFLVRMDQLPQADQWLQKLLQEPEVAKDPKPWRLARQIASKRDMPSRALASLERALELEFRNLPEVINLKQVRQDYGSLLDQYERLSESLRALSLELPNGFLQKVVRTTDRWRSIDSEQSTPCETTARILQRWGQKELAWDYMTTPVGLQPYEAGKWHQMAQSLRRRGDRGLADLAFASAFAIEPTNAQYLWDRAQNLREGGKPAEAQVLLRQLVNTQWQPRFRSLKSQAQWQLEQR